MARNTAVLAMALLLAGALPFGALAAEKPERTTPSGLPGPSGR